MKYSVNLIMKNPDQAKFLIDCKDTNDIVNAFEIANDLLHHNDVKGHFVEIVDNDSGEKIAGINEGE